MKKKALPIVGLLFALLVIVHMAAGDKLNLHLTPEVFSATDWSTQDVNLESTLQTLKPGTYKITVSYSNTSSDAICKVYSESFVNSNNISGRIFNEQALPSTQNAVTFTFELPDTIYDLKIGFATPQEGFAIGSAYITSNGFYYYDTLIFLALSVIVLALFWIYRKSLAKRENRILVFYFAAIACISTLPLFNDFLIDGHDLSFQLTRIDGIAEGLRDGQFPVRMNTIFGNNNGYISPMMYPELFLYFPAILRLLGMSVMNAYKVFCFTLNLGTAVIAYYGFSRLCRSRHIGLMGSALYTLSLYRLVNMYTRGAVAEALAMAFLPLIILGMYEVFYGNEKNYKWLVLGYTGVFGSHIVTTELCLLFCALFGVLSIVQLKDVKRLAALLKAVLFTALLNLWFILPFLFYYSKDLYILSLHYAIEDYGVYFSQLFNTFIGSDGLAVTLGTTVGEMAATVGGLLGLGILLYLFGRFILRKNYREHPALLESVGDYSFLFGMIALIVASNLFPWSLVQRLPLVGGILSAIQYPWRYLIIASVFLCLLAAIAIYRFAKNDTWAKYLTIGTILLSIFASAFYLDDCTQIAPRMTDKYQPYDINCLYDGQYYYETTDMWDVLNRERNLVSNADITFSEYKKSGSELSFSYSGTDIHADTYVEVPYLYYDGYVAVLNESEQLEVSRGENDILRITLPEDTNSGQIKVSYEGKWFFHVGTIISLFTLAGIGITTLKKHKKQ